MTSNRISSSSGFTRTLAHRARRNFPLALSVAVLLFAAGMLAAAGQTEIPASATLRDNTTDAIRSDTISHTYVQGQDCALSFVQNGQYFLRTVDPFCPLALDVRALILDFSHPVTPVPSNNCYIGDPNSGPTLYACGYNLVQDVRLIAQSLFKASPGSTTVSLPFSLYPDFTGSAAFELDFELAVPFTGSGNERILVAGSKAVAQLYQIGAHGHKISIGRYYMPFGLTVTEP